MSTPENFFQELAQIFSTRQNRILEIEILLPGLGPLLQDDCSIGITKKALVQAFVVARRIFFDGIANKPGTEPHDEGVNADKLLVSSEILLLFDCEHLTACNFRKGWLAALIQDYDVSKDESSREKLIQTLNSEITLMTTYLCSPLHRHTKSPTLWQHRFWVLMQLLRAQGLELTEQSIVYQAGLDLEAIPELLKAELTIALRAGELHPKNFYAFTYMRQLHDALSNLDQEPEISREILARVIIRPTVDWCLSHPRDISGWMFALYLMEAVPDDDIHANIINRVIKFALDVGWESESLWTFVDLAIRVFDRNIVHGKIHTTAKIFSLPIILDEHIDDKALPKKPWKIWLARARAYWAADLSKRSENDDTKRPEA